LDGDSGQVKMPKRICLSLCCVPPLSTGVEIHAGVVLKGLGGKARLMPSKGSLEDWGRRWVRKVFKEKGGGE